MSEMKNIDNNNLENVTGGNGYPQGELHVAEPNVKAGTYLALRSSHPGMTPMRSRRSIRETGSM